MQQHLILVTLHIAPTFAVLPIPSCLGGTLVTCGSVVAVRSSWAHGDAVLGGA